MRKLSGNGTYAADSIVLRSCVPSFAKEASTPSTPSRLVPDIRPMNKAGVVGMEMKKPFVTQGFYSSGVANGLKYNAADASGIYSMPVWYFCLVAPIMRSDAPCRWRLCGYAATRNHSMPVHWECRRKVGRAARY